MHRPLRRIPLITAVTASLGLAFALGQAPAEAASTVTVDGGVTYQRIDGFGFSEAFGQANSIRTAQSSTRQQALDMLFSTSDGAGFSILRNLIPAGSDSIEPVSPGSPNATPHYVWDASNDATDEGQLWLARQAKGYGVTDLYNDAWSAPGFMKTNGSDTGGGSLCGTPGASCGSGDWRRAYANYLLQDAKFWASAGLAPSAIDFVNEPSLTTSYASMLASPAQATSFLPVFGPAMKASGLSTEIACCDTVGFNDLPSYLSSLAGNSAANSAVGLLSSHGYSGAPTSPLNSGGRHVWQSEWSINGNGWDTAWDDGTDASGFTWAQQVYTGLTKADINAFLYWWGVSSTSHDSSLIGLNGSALTPSKRYYALAAYSRFIRPGATRISAGGGPGGLDVSAYRNTDGSVIVVALNTGTSSVPTNIALTGTGSSSGHATPYLTNAGNGMAAQPTVTLANGSFGATIPARSLITYRITR